MKPPTPPASETLEERIKRLEAWMRRLTAAIEKHLKTLDSPRNAKSSERGNSDVGPNR